MANKFLNQDGLATLWEQIKLKFIDDAELQQALSNYKTAAELVEILSNYVTNAALAQELANYVIKEINSDDGKALIFNESDGGGAKFEGNDGYAAFAGVNSDVRSGIGAQLYDINVSTNKGAKLDVTANGIYYTSGDDSALPAAQRDVEDNELATKKDIIGMATNLHIEKLADAGEFAARYQLQDGEGTAHGATINIPKDYLVKSAEVKTCTQKDVPIEGLNPGDKYIDFTINAKEGSGTESHIYIAIKDLVEPYSAGYGIVINSDNSITFDPDVLATVTYVDMSLTDTITYFEQELANEHAGRVAGDNLKVDKKVSGTNGQAFIFNESDGGGAKFVNNDGLESFVGVNDGGEDGLAAQIYADKLVDGKWQGAKIDVTNEGIYYTVGNQTFAERAVEGNEIATMKDVEAAEPEAMTEQEIRDICQ